MAQQTSALWKALLRDRETRREYAFDIDGVWYGPEAEASHSVESSLFECFGIGNAMSATLTLELYADHIPRGAVIKRFVRLTNGAQASEWLPKGVFYISTRRLDKRSGTLAIHGYDAMRKAGDIWLTADYDTAGWPMPQREAAEDIAQRMGVELDPRTVLDAQNPVEYPTDDLGEVTMTDILEWIAIANGGNWVMTDEGKLLLLGYGDIPEETNYLVTEYGSAITMGGVRLLVG